MPSRARTSAAASKIARDLHLVDLGEGDAQAAAAMAEHRVRLVQLLRRARATFAAAIAHAPRQLSNCSALVVRQELVQRRIEQPDRRPAARPSPRRCRRSRCAASAAAVASAAARSASSSARIICARRRCVLAKNMCSVRHRPMPSAPNARATRASCGVSALVRTPSRRVRSAQRISVRELPVERRLRRRAASARRAPAGSPTGCGSSAPADHLARRAVDRQRIALARAIVPPRCSRARFARPRRRLSRRRRTACPSRARRPPRARSCRRGSSGCRPPRPSRRCPPGWSRRARAAPLRLRSASCSRRRRVKRSRPMPRRDPRAARARATRPVSHARARAPPGRTPGARSCTSMSGSIALHQLLVVDQRLRATQVERRCSTRGERRCACPCASAACRACRARS